MSRKNKKTTKWFSYDPLLKYGCKTNVAFGLRRNGKTYDAKRLIINAISEGKQFVYIRRKHKHIVKAKMMTLFADIEEYCMEKLGSYIYFEPSIGFYIIIDKEQKVVGSVASIEFAMDYKGITYTAGIVYFDEFVDYSYFDDEIKRYLNLIKTITGNRKDVIILLSANSVSKRCPYFDLFGIDIQKFKKGSVATIKHKNGATIAVEYCRPRVDDIEKEQQDLYVGFDNNGTVNMIMHGEWEYDEYNTKYVDGVGWNSTRNLIPVYYNSLGKVYELTLYKDTKYPIAFVREINTQNGVVRKEIRYSIVSNDSIQLKYANDFIVPAFTRISKLFFDEKTYEDMQTFIECIKCGRTVYDTVETGTEFNAFFVNTI